MSLSTMQRNAVSDMKTWYKGMSDQYFVLAGYAGTGKTYMILHAMQDLGIPLYKVAFITYTGKAALVLTQKADGKFTCHTMHHFLYEPEVDSKGHVTFSPKAKTEFEHIELVVNDECSMPDEGILEDLLSIGKKVLFVGDHGQLEPIGELTWLYKRLQDADATLTEIHRQAEGNSIIQASMMARQGKLLPFGKLGNNVYVVSKEDLDNKSGIQKSLLSADQVLCGVNKTRHRYNRVIRERLGFGGLYPKEGEKLICLKNDWDKTAGGYALVNGLIGYAHNVEYNRADQNFRNHIKFDLMPDFAGDDASKIFEGIRILPEPFKDIEVPFDRNDYGKYCSFDYGYVITTHKSQGSQWDNVVYLDEAFGDDPNRHRYTGITRASKRLLYIRKKRSQKFFVAAKR